MSTTRATRSTPRKPAWIRGLFPIAISLSILWLLRDTLQTLDTAAIMASVLHVSPAQWVVAALLTATSFYAIAQYDRLIAAEMGLSLPRRQALSAGWRATAISQVLGYGLVTGALTRWRALGRAADLSLWDCSRLTLGVTCAFFAGWAVVAALAVTLAPPQGLGQWPAFLGPLGVLVALLVCWASIVPPQRYAALIPPPRLVLPVIGFTTLDTLAAASVIFLFLPEGSASFPMLYAAFLIAFGAGMMSGLPGGIGAFELCFLTLLAPADPAPFLSAIMAYRLIYYATPAVLAGLTLMKVPSKPQCQAPDIRTLPRLPSNLANYAPPEADLIVQTPLQLVVGSRLRSAALWHRSRNCDLVLGSIFGPTGRQDLLTQMSKNAARAGRGLCLYKCNATTAAIALRAGFWTVKTGSEAVIDARSFDTAGPSHRQLRRKLRHAGKAGITCHETTPPYATLAAIDAEWQASHGRARGFSMGYLCPALLARQKLFVASKGGAPIAFITLLCGPQGWTLDVMRVPEGCPDGTAHALVISAISAARETNVARVSLAAAPFYIPATNGTIADRAIGLVFDKAASLRGLARFKSSFAPTWQPRYIAASGSLALCYAALDLWHLIRRKSAVEQNITPPNMQPTHDHYGFYEFASNDPPCHALQRMTSKDARHEPDR